ncbi:MAG: NAD(P)-dependent oxidoreductase [Proteobacteria bacterium]|nr:NAD(P)-dependent oxidoreductase [Pseudomonadota bacterium]
MGTKRAKRLGFIGVGAMGLPMMANLVRAGFAVRACDVDPARLAAAVAAGAEAAASPREAATAREAVLLSLPDARAVEAVVFGPGGIAEALPGSPRAPDPGAGPRLTVIDLTSSRAETSRRVGALLAGAGGAFLEAPVSGGVGGARKGTLSIMVAGDPAVMEAERDVLSAIGTSIRHAGPLGHANLVKALNNLVSTANLLIAAEAVLIAARAGLSVGRFAEAAQATLGASDALGRKLLDNLLRRAGTSRFRLPLLYKDLSYATELAAETKAGDVVSGLAREVVAEALARFGEDGIGLQAAHALEAWEADGPGALPPV